MGSEFAYEDISSQELEKYTYKFTGEEKFDGRNHLMVERFPTNPKSGYHRQMVWYDDTEFRIWKIVFYDRRNDLFKTLTYEGYNQYLGKYWRANVMQMDNDKTGKSTTLTFSDYKFAIGTTDTDFTANRLKRAR